MTYTRRKRPSLIARLVKFFTIFSILGAVLGAIALYALYRHIEPQLPSTSSLRTVKYQIPLSVYSRDAKLIAQFGEKKRKPVGIDDTPEQLIQAVLSAEDDRFFQHPGVDYQGLLRAALEFAKTGKKSQGGSTITMQVARNFFLSREKTFLRKIKEIFLSLKIERELKKREILELYLNKIYFGHRAYGIGSAAQTYYGLPLHDLELAQLAMIAGLPKAPSKFNPLTNPNRALARRNYVLRRMHELNHISDNEYKIARQQPVVASLHADMTELRAPYVAEMVRKEMLERFGDKTYSEGFKVYTTIESRLQATADIALRRALHEYDERHGYRGPESQLNAESPEDWEDTIKKLPKVGDTLPGIVEAVDEKTIKVYRNPNETITINWDGLSWARAYRDENTRGDAPQSASDIAQIGDIVRVRRQGDKWILSQIPKAEGALISLHPRDGSVLALTGGFDFYRSKYNRVTQSKRQPGSGFKSILYTTALESGFTAASIINDAPIVFNDPSTETEWRPQNYSGKFYGPTRLRVALRKSRNLVSIRLLRELGIGKVRESAKRFGFKSHQLPRSLTLALGSGHASPLDMARVFAVFANGGFLIEPYYIERIEALNGEVLFEASPKLACDPCEYTVGVEPESAREIISPEIHFLMTSLLQDVIRRGTGKRALQLGRNDIGGKTGTTNNQRDAWFNGFTATNTTVTWVGFDSSKPLGKGETGGRVALPMWIYFMEVALQGVPEQPLVEPPGIVDVYIDPTTGLRTFPETKDAVLESFVSETEPEDWATDRPMPFTDEVSDDSEIRSLF